jgi:hypothetical protein
METPYEKSNRRLAKKDQMKELIERENYNNKYFKEEILTQGAFVMSRMKVRKNPVELNEIELLTLVAKLKRPRHTDEEIGKMFREIFKD